ncbi:MAG: tetratricopeptide repeat protein [Treponema sp.]|jgi:tetratricopeptide (TPR) repeat protein|nr:tetratricopeptide repeat protein [Treponema sp.]
MKPRPLLAAFVFLTLTLAGFAQTTVPFPPPDTEAAAKYAGWVKNAMDEGRWSEALIVLERASDFADVSSDISWLLALARSRLDKPRGEVLEALQKAVDTDHWRRYNRTDALFMAAEVLIPLRFFHAALEILSGLPENADTARLRLLALRNAGYYEQFLAETGKALNRYPRDARLARIYLEYLEKEYLYGEDSYRKDFPRKDLQNRNPGKLELELLDLILRRLPALLEGDRELAWMAAPFAADPEDAGRIVAAYRASGKAAPASLPAALKFGIIDEDEAIGEFFAPPEEGELSLDRALITGIWDQLRTDRSRVLFCRNLSGFSGVIIEDGDRDGINESWVNYRDGRIQTSFFDANQDGFRESVVYFEAGEPAGAEWAAVSQSSSDRSYWPQADEAVRRTAIRWERYPAVLETRQSGIRYIPRPGDFFFSPLRFIELPESSPSPGSSLLYPERDPSAAALTLRTLISFALRVERPSREFPGATETVDLDGTVPIQAREYLGDRLVSVTDFSRGRPVTQSVDLNLDGRLETTRFFRQPSPSGGEGGDPADPFGLLDYSLDFEYADSDWDGDGVFEEREYAAEKGKGAGDVFDE